MHFFTSGGDSQESFSRYDKKSTSYLSSFLCGKAHALTTALCKVGRVNWRADSSNSGATVGCRVTRGSHGSPPFHRGVHVSWLRLRSPIPLLVSAPRSGTAPAAGPPQPRLRGRSAGAARFLPLLAASVGAAASERSSCLAGETRLSFLLAVKRWS